MPRKSPALDLDFDIHVDPSCLSAPMDDESPATMPPSPSPEEAQDTPAVSDAPEAPVVDVTEGATEDADHTTQDTPRGTEEAQEAPAAEPEVTTEVDPPAEEQPDSKVTEQEPAVEEQQEAAADDTPSDDTTAPGDVEQATSAEDTLPAEDIAVPAAISEGDAAPEVDDTAEPEVEEPIAELETEVALDSEPVEEAVSEPEAQLLEAEAASESEPVQEPVADSIAQLEEQLAQDKEMAAPEVEQDTTDERADAIAVDEPQEADDTATNDPQISQEVQLEENPQEEGQDLAIQDADASTLQDGESDVEEERGPHRSFVDRKTSLRTEALIQAAARAVVAKIEKRKSGDLPAEEDEFDNSLISNGSQDTHVLGDDAQSTLSDHQPPSRRQSSDSHVRHIPSRSTSSDDAGDSSSPNERDDDVFSDRSARSSLCSLDDSDHTNTPQAKASLSRRDSYTSSVHHHSPSPARTASNFSTISEMGLSTYDDFVPTTTREGTRRMPFRTPSEIRAMQMASPTPSVFNGSSPSRSGKRQSLSRLGSPAASAQYSPKGRTTPTRFKGGVKKEAPLVLLHVTLLPLRWVWGEVLNGLDAVTSTNTANSKTGDVVIEEEAFAPSEQLKTLRDAWRELQDRVGDTVLERGILLPHPQNDYEVLEERLLEALELPLRRRARILECGHYVGPANVEGEEGESDDEGAEGKRHWCGTCCREIRYEDLGVGKVFRVKVYASNGLMRAGAWEACWKEMERVDVEVEPIVGVAVQSELEKLAVLQLEMEEQRQRELVAERAPETEVTPEADLRAPSRQHTELPSEAELAHMDAQRAMMSSPAPSAMQLAMRASTPQPSASTTLVRAGTPTAYAVDTSEERRLRDEERMREIYGDMPSAPSPAPAPAQLPAPPMPTEQQQQQQQQHYPHPQPIHPHALTTAPPPPPAMPMLTDGSALPHHHQDPYNPRSAPDDTYAPHRQGQRPPRPIVLDENSGFVELLMEAFKVLLRDPKNVAIIVLCVFLVVMMKRPGMMGEQQAQGQVVQVQSAGSGQAVGGGYRYEGFEAAPKVAVGPVVAPRDQEGGVVGYVEEVVASTALPTVEGLGGVVAAVEAPEGEAGGEVEEVVVEEPKEEVVAGIVEVEDFEPAEEVVKPEITAEAEALDFSLPADVCAPRGLEYPITIVGEAPVLEETEVQDDSSTASEVSPDLDPEADQTILADSVPVEDDVETSTATSAAEGLETPASPDTPDEATADEAADTLLDAETETEREEPSGKCEIDADADIDSDSDTEEALPTPSTSASAASTSVFIPGPFITERKTVRVFETVTETVRVSVVTQTETVSTVVTAIPQTVEETVYETETVRITVSVPVEEQKKMKAKERNGCKGKKGWF
ncbi:hypothetical protein C8A01DRAFT_37884 [Parachaetomium inaequale]|uniref:Pathway-specific nitrogen regulator n=1 Tax=Parachaetomium inaequale TaxID=2588326 RepID=A0AAN6SPE2_9PEZI|nr:hypothetical protein C8A01DRAFT_37884 [Parachaetomium inaequale]